MFTQGRGTLLWNVGSRTGTIQLKTKCKFIYPHSGVGSALSITDLF